MPLPFCMEDTMLYHVEKPELYANQYGKVYICDHPVYSRCTLYRIGEKGLAVIQQRFDSLSKLSLIHIS